MVPDRRISLFSVLAVVLGLGVAAMMYWPYRIGEKIARNEDNALRALDDIRRFIAQPKEVPEGWRFAFLQELRQSPAVGATFTEQLGEAFSGDDLRIGGYRFRSFLPDREGNGVSYGRREQVNDRRAARAYACYAWPHAYGRTGRRAFVLGADGLIHATENRSRRYGGEQRAPDPGAAFTVDNPQRLATRPSREVAEGRHWGADGQLWMKFDPPRP